MNTQNQLLLNWYFDNNRDAVLVCKGPKELAKEEGYILCTQEEAQKVMELYSQVFLIVEQARKRNKDGKYN